MRRALAIFSSKLVARLTVVVCLAAVAGWYVVGVRPGDGVPPGPNSTTDVIVSGDLTEDVGFDQRLTGRFSVDIHPRGVVGSRPGPQHVSANAAVAWARRHDADVVYITAGYHQWVTGPAASPGLGQPRWPADGIVFHARFGYEPVSGPRPRAWWVRLSYDEHAPPAATIGKVLSAPGRCLRVHVVDAGRKPDIDCLVPFNRERSAIGMASAFSGAVPIEPPGPSLWNRLFHPNRDFFWTGGAGFVVLGPVGEARSTF